MGKIIENYSLQQLLGQGVYGKVYKGIHIRTKQEVAVKVIKADKFREIPKLEECTVNEINTLSMMEPNPHIVRYLDMLKTVNNFYFVYEFCNGGTLEKVLQTYRNSPEKVMPLTKSLLYFRDVLDAFKTLTKNSIMHRDLKPDNILLHNGVIKLADFGFCKSLKSPTDLAQTMLGSPIYMAPQVITGQNYTMKADIWSLGVVLYEMVYGKCPFQESSIAKLIQLLQSQELEIPFQVPEVVQTLIKRMLVKDPAKRIDWVDIFEYKIMDNGDVIEPRHLSINPQLKSSKNINPPTQLFNPSLSMGGNSQNIFRATAGQITTIRQDTSFGDSSSYRMPATKVDAIKGTPSLRRKSPSHNEPVKYGQSGDGSVKQSFSSVSPLRERKSIYGQLVKKHKKLTYVAKLSLDIMRENPKDGTVLSFLISQTMERELQSILESIRKEQPVGPEDEPLRIQFSQQLQSEMKDIRDMLRFMRDDVEKCEGDSKNAYGNRGRYLKRYIQTFRAGFEGDQDKAILASQLLDYFQDGILLKKQAYRTLTKEHLIRQINLKVAKLN